MRNISCFYKRFSEKILLMMRVLIILLLSLFFLKCDLILKEKKKSGKREFSFCKELSEKECMPPLLEKEALYLIENADTTGTMENFITSLRKNDDSISFHLKFSNSLEKEKLEYWKKEFRVFYNFEDAEKRYQLKETKVDTKGAYARIPLHLVLAQKFHHALQEPYKKPPVFTIHYELYLEDKIFGTRSIALRFKVNTVTIH